MLECSFLNPLSLEIKITQDSSTIRLCMGAGAYNIENNYHWIKRKAVNIEFR